MLTRIFRYAIQNSLRNTFLSLSSIMIITLLIFFINILIVLQAVSFQIIDIINDRLTISLYLADTYDKNSPEVITLQNDIRKAIPNIDFTYKTREEVLEDIREQDPQLVNILELENPLPETIILENIPLSSYEILNTLIEKRLFILTQNESNDEKAYFSNYEKQFERIETIIQVLKVLQLGLLIVILTFIVSIAIIVYSIIGNFIYYYRDEIYITRLVWGSKIFIYGPFTLQWMLYVALSFMLAIILFLLFLSNLRYLLNLESLTVLFPWNIFFLFFLQVLIFLSVWGLSWFFSSQKYLTKK